MEIESPRARASSEDGEVRRSLAQASNLPRHYYHDLRIYEKEMDRFFTRMWLFAGREEDIPKPGDYIVRNIGAESVVIVRSQDHKVRAFHNFCRHRGTRLLSDARGSTGGAIQCEYHAWTYGLDGSLLGAPHMDLTEGFDRADYPLLPVRLERWQGFLAINLSLDAPTLREALGTFLDKWKGFRLDELRRSGHLVYDLPINWKILEENYSECYHCAPIHPELNRITRYDGGKNYDYLTHGKLYSGGYMEFNGDYTSMTLSGYSKRPPIRGFPKDELRRLYYFLVFPNMFFSLDPDYLMVHLIWPDGPERSIVECDFYFDPPAMGDPSFDPSDAVQMWDTINRQDWHVCEKTHRGTASRFNVPGRFSNQENLVHDFDKFIVEGLGGDEA